MGVLYQASIDGIGLEMETIEDEFSKAVARYEFPFAHGALLEDLGQKARTVRLRCYFWDDGAGHRTYDDHTSLINHLAATVVSELVHPLYGVMQGCVEQVSIRHDDRIRHAEVDITFVEQMRGEISPEKSRDVAAGAEGEFAEGQGEQEDEFALDAAAALEEEKGVVFKAMDTAQGIYGQFSGLSRFAWEFLGEIDRYVSLFQAEAAEIVNPVNSLLAAVSYGASLPGRVVGPIAQALERIARLHDSLRSSPGRYLSGLSQAFASLTEAARKFSLSASRAGKAARALILKHVKIAAALRLALEASYLYKEDEANRRKLRRAETARSFDARGRYLRPAEDVLVMNVRELESSLTAVRRMIQIAVDEARSVRSLQSMARLLLEHVYTVKLEREKIVEIELDNPLPLHLVCLRCGLPYNYAERIRLINPALSNPNFTSGKVAVYVR